VKLFGLGNEIYGNWQPGQKTAAECAAWCAEAIRQMKMVDPTIRVVVCGLGRPNPEWDRTVLFRLIDQADMISLHNYFGRPVFEDLMASSRICEQMVAAVNCAIDEAMDTTLGVHPCSHRELGALPSVKRRPGIAFDEWNLWYRAACGPMLNDAEEVYNYSDALAAASLLHVILRNAATIELAGISLAVNTIVPIITDRDRMVRQTTLYAQKMLRDAHAGRIVETVVDGPTFKAKHERFFCGVVDPDTAKDESLPTLEHFDDIPAIDAVAGVDDKRARRAAYSIPNTMHSWVVDTNPAQAGRAFALGMYLCLCTHGNEATLAEEPVFGEYVHKLAKLRKRSADHTVHARFRDRQGIDVQVHGAGEAYAFDGPLGP